MADEREEKKDGKFLEREPVGGGGRATGTPRGSDGIAHGEVRHRGDARRRLEDYLEEKRLRERIHDYLSE